MQDEEVLDNEKSETPEEKASKIDKQYLNEMAFIAKVLGTSPENPISNQRTVGDDVVANVVARLFKEREEKLVEEVYKGLGDLVDIHLKAEAALKQEEQKLKAMRTEKRKEFIKVAKAWRSKIDQQSISKESYKETLSKAIEASKQEE